MARALSDIPTKMRATLGRPPSFADARRAGWKGDEAAWTAAIGAANAHRPDDAFSAEAGAYTWGESGWPTATADASEWVRAANHWNLLVAYYNAALPGSGLRVVRTT
jgi:hypothetical protein